MNMRWLTYLAGQVDHGNASWNGRVVSEEKREQEEKSEQHQYWNT